jgi:hypothetical protein
MNPAKIGQVFGALAKALQKRDKYIRNGLCTRAARDRWRRKSSGGGCSSHSSSC